MTELLSRPLPSRTTVGAIGAAGVVGGLLGIATLATVPTLTYSWPYLRLFMTAVASMAVVSALVVAALCARLMARRRSAIGTARIVAADLEVSQVRFGEVDPRLVDDAIDIRDNLIAAGDITVAERLQTVLTAVLR